MTKFGVCGHLGEGKNLLNGQTVKTKVLIHELINQCGKDNVVCLDTHAWKKEPFKLLKGAINLIKEVEYIIILPAKRGIKVFGPLFLFLNLFFNRNLHYIVIGGWLPELLEKNKWLAKQLRKFDGIYVETNSMVVRLEDMGFSNVYFIPNFKELKIIPKNELVYISSTPYKLCTFSRVMKEKGIETAINAVRKVNNKHGKIVLTLDIYGQIDENYLERFNELQLDFPSYIQYCGSVHYDKSSSTLQQYFALLFPTCYEGEGFAGTILDAYAAGVPVIASDWKYNKEVIKSNTGIIFDNSKEGELERILEIILESPAVISDKKQACLEKAHDYLPHKVVRDFLNNVESER